VRRANRQAVADSSLRRSPARDERRSAAPHRDHGPPLLARSVAPLSRPAQPSGAPVDARSDDVGTAVRRPEESLGTAPLAAFVPFDAAAPAPKRARTQPLASGAAAPQAALVFVDRGGGDADAPIADEAAAGAAMLVSAERPRYALLTQQTVDAAAAAAAKRAAQTRGQQGGGSGKNKRGRGGGRGAGDGRGGGGGRDGGDAALSLLLGGTGMDGW
jgi:hypothetical protein